MSKSTHGNRLLSWFSACIFLCLFFLSNAGVTQVRINATVYYEADPSDPTAKVKVFKDNKLYDELNTNKKGKFKMMLQLGHDFLFEVSKEYHFTTRFIVSTKLPEAKMQEDVYASFDIETDLIKNFLGLDGSIMDKPIMILRYLPEENNFDFDKTHLKAVQSRVNKLMNESERLERKGAKAIAKPIPKDARKAEVKQAESKPAPKTQKDEEILGSTTQRDEESEQTTSSLSDQAETDDSQTANESYEMRMRRERLEREKEKRANLALKRGYESSLIRQVAEENRKLSKAEIEQRTQEKEDSSLIEKARVENEIKEYKNQQREKQTAFEAEATANMQTKAQMETGMIRAVATSNRDLRSEKDPENATEMDGEEKRFQIDPKVRETTSTDNFKEVEDLYLDYPSYTIQYSKETYDFGMVNYYIDKQAVDKDEFCKRIAALKAYKIKLTCE